MTDDETVPNGLGSRETRAVRLLRPAVDPARARWNSGWPYPFRPEPWEELAERYADLMGHLPKFAHMLSIIDSVRRSSAHAELGVFTSMHDLMIRPLPATDPPYDLVAVRAPGSLRRIKSGSVLIEHLSTTARDDCIERPVAEAVPLFWRFVAEKFCVTRRPAP